MIKKYLGYLFVLAPIFFAFCRGKKQGELNCIDFNVLPIVANFITFMICLTLMTVGIVLIEKNKK